MIAVTFALPDESRDFVRLLDRRAGDVKVLHTGVGSTITRARIGALLEAQRLDFVISSGFAGAADASLGVGNLLLAENFSDPLLLARARTAINARVAKLITAERVIESAVERTQFARAHDAAAIDMETEWIARACAERTIPMLSLRVISDSAAAPFPAPASVLFDLERQSTNPARLAGHLLTHPVRIVSLMRFARQIARARASLTNALLLLLQALP